MQNIFLFLSSLPKTAYMKMIDIWSIVCMSMPFFEIILLTIIDDWSRKRDGAEKQKGIKNRKHTINLDFLQFNFLVEMAGNLSQKWTTTDADNSVKVFHYNLTVQTIRKYSELLK